MKDMLDSTIVVIRSSNERTSGLCRELCLKQTSEDNLKIVQEVPFERALRKCYETGIASNKKWMVTVDADVLLVDSAIETLIQNAELMPQHYIQLEGRVFDKITGLYRQAGHRIYRAELLPLSLNQIPPEGEQVRPEFFTLQQMGALGNPSRRIPDVVGLHDFEQSFFDLYRKSFVHAVKHPYWINDLIVRSTKRLDIDADYLVVLKGLWDGMTTKSIVSIDKRKFIEVGMAALESLGLEEKRSIEDVDRFKHTFPEYFTRVTTKQLAPQFILQDEPKNEDRGRNKWAPEIQARIARHGFLRGGIASFGGLLVRIGRYLDKGATS